MADKQKPNDVPTETLGSGASVATAETASTIEGNGSAPATSFAPSGAPEQTVVDVDPSHPALDNDPRAGTTAEQNRIDLNDPTISGAEAVERNLAAQAQG